MYIQGSEECLRNAERKLDDAGFLLEKKSFGSAQSLCVTALEEMAKAIILEFADLNYVGGDVVKDSMRHHPSKQTIIEAFEKGILFVGSLDFRDKESKNDMDDKFIDMGKLKELKELLSSNLELNKKRLNGLYVQVDETNGSITSSPLTVFPPEVSYFCEKCRDLLVESWAIYEAVKEYLTDSPEADMRNNLYRFKDEFGNFSISYDEV